MKCSYGTSHVVKNSVKAVDRAGAVVSIEAIEEYGKRSVTNVHQLAQKNARTNSENQNVTETHLKHQPPTAQQAQTPSRERIPIDVQEILVLVRLLARDAFPGDVVRVSDRVGVAVVCVGAGERVRITSRFGLFHKAQKYYSTKARICNEKKKKKSWGKTNAPVQCHSCDCVILTSNRPFYRFSGRAARSISRKRGKER
jgi:hypothetical protein